MRRTMRLAALAGAAAAVAALCLPAVAGADRSRVRRSGGIGRREFAGLRPDQRHRPATRS